MIVLSKEEVGTVYFKRKDKTGHTFTSSIKDAMEFKTEVEAINYNYKNLYGDCEVIFIKQ